MKLFDINILLYAVDPSAPQHARAKAFLERALDSDEAVALPWAVITGFIRLTTNRRMILQPTSPATACAIVAAWLDHPHVVTLQPGPEHWRVMRELIEAVGIGGNLINDAHLAAMAIENGAELCSADSDFARFPRLKWTDPTRG